MRLVYPTICQAIEINEGRTSSLVVENPEFLYEITESLKNQVDGCDGKFVLSEKDKILDISKNVELVTDFFSFDINNKSLLNKVVSTFEKVAVSPQFYERTYVLLSDIEKFIYDISFDYNIDIICDKINIGQILKSVSIKVSNDYASILDRLFAWMELIREFDSDKLFVFINLRSFVSAEKLQIFLDTANSHQYKILLIDNCDYELLKNESRLIIDRDLCEI